MVPPHVRQSTSDTAAAFPTSAWQLEHRRIDASQEIVVTTTTLTLRISDLDRKFSHRENTVLSASEIRLGCTSGLSTASIPQLWAGVAPHVGHVTARARSRILGRFTPLAILTALVGSRGGISAAFSLLEKDQQRRYADARQRPDREQERSE
jgi:hypothetical protein